MHISLALKCIFVQKFLWQNVVVTINIDMITKSGHNIDNVGDSYLINQVLKNGT